VFTADILEGNNYLDISFEKLQSWRDLEDQVIPLTSIFQATQDLLQELEKMAIRFVERTDRRVTQANGQVQINFFSSRRSITQALMASATGLQKRIHGVLNLVRDPAMAPHLVKLTCRSLPTH
jgi:hypothetical protein